MSTSKIENVYESVVNRIKGPKFRNPIRDFLDENCNHFVDVKENTLEMGLYFKEFSKLIDSLLQKIYKDFDITEDEFAVIFQRGLNDNNCQRYFTQLRNFSNFNFFKKLMIDRYYKIIRLVENELRKRKGLLEQNNDENDNFCNEMNEAKKKSKLESLNENEKNRRLKVLEEVEIQRMIKKSNKKLNKKEEKKKNNNNNNNTNNNLNEPSSQSKGQKSPIFNPIPLERKKKLAPINKNIHRDSINDSNDNKISKIPDSIKDSNDNGNDNQTDLQTPNSIHSSRINNNEPNQPFSGDQNENDNPLDSTQNLDEQKSEVSFAKNSRILENGDKKQDNQNNLNNKNSNQNNKNIQRIDDEPNQPFSGDQNENDNPLDSTQNLDEQKSEVSFAKNSRILENGDKKQDNQNNLNNKNSNQNNKNIQRIDGEPNENLNDNDNVNDNLNINQELDEKNNNNNYNKNNKNNKNKNNNNNNNNNNKNKNKNNKKNNNKNKNNNKQNNKNNIEEDDQKEADIEELLINDNDNDNENDNDNDNDNKDEDEDEDEDFDFDSAKMDKYLTFYMSKGNNSYLNDSNFYQIRKMNYDGDDDILYSKLISNDSNNNVDLINSVDENDTLDNKKNEEKNNNLIKESDDDDDDDNDEY